jgi:hypothetical protein
MAKAKKKKIVEEQVQSTPQESMKEEQTPLAPPAVDEAPQIETKRKQVARGFTAWLGRQKIRVDEVGRLARYAKDDPDWPQQGDREAIAIYLGGVDLSVKLTGEKQERYRAFLKAWREYQPHQ